jgi:hypothetical protein
MGMIADAVNWLMNVPFDKSPKPDLHASEIDTLNSIFNMCVEGHRRENVLTLSTDGALGLVDSTFVCSPDDFRLIRMSVESFYREIGHSPNEVLIVTGLPLSSLETLVRRIELASK